MFKPIIENLRNLSNLFYGQTQTLQFRWKGTKISTLSFGLKQNIIW